MRLQCRKCWFFLAQEEPSLLVLSNNKFLCTYMTQNSVYFSLSKVKNLLNCVILIYWKKINRLFIRFKYKHIPLTNYRELNAVREVFYYYYINLYVILYRYTIGCVQMYSKGIIIIFATKNFSASISIHITLVKFDIYIGTFVHLQSTYL